MRIETNNLCASYGPRRVLRDVNLAVEPGELMALLGPSGSGKSTLLEILAGLRPADGGRVELDGRDAARLSPRERRIGMVFQDLALWPHMSVQQHLRFASRDGGGAASIPELLALLELTEHAHKRPDTLSGGEAQRLALARAMVSEPRLLLLDEPLGSLDRRLREHLLDLLRMLHRRSGATALCVTHDYDEAFAIADRVAVLVDGELLQVGTPHEVYRHPTTARVAELAGPVTLIPAEVRDGRAQLAFGELPVEGAEGPGHLVLRPEDLAVAPGGGATVTDCRLRGGRWQVAVEVGDQCLLATADSELRPGSKVALNPVQPVWFLGDGTER